MTSAMLRLADNKPGSGARLGNVCFDAEAMGFGEAPLPSLRELVQASVVPRLCRALNLRSVGSASVGARALAAATVGSSFNALAANELVPVVPNDRERAGSQDRPRFGRGAGAGEVVIAHDLVDDIVHGLLINDVDGVCARVDAIRARGGSLERIFLDLLMPAAVHLDRLLAEDLHDCAAVTIAYLNLHGVLRRFSGDFRDEGGIVDTGSRALLASPQAPSGTAGLQMFGLLFMAEFFRRDGWDALTERSLSSASFRDTVESQWFDIVEVLASGDEDLDEIASGIRLIRRGARNRDVGIIACGRIFSERPEIISLVGADRSASDLPTGLALAKAFVLRPPARQLLS